MYLIIIEGTDNIGKDTLKNKLIEAFDSVSVIHCHGPQAKIFINNTQDNQFITYANDIAKGKYDSTDCIIMNRSHYGEYVYGQLYRGRTKNSILYMINKVDGILTSRKDLTIKYIQLISSSVSLRKSNDDGQSLSEMDIEKMENETKLFRQIYHQSILDKIMIDVNNGHDEFRPVDEIYNEVIKFIES